MYPRVLLFLVCVVQQPGTFGVLGMAFNFAPRYLLFFIPFSSAGVSSSLPLLYYTVLPLFVSGPRLRERPLRWVSLEGQVIGVDTQDAPSGLWGVLDAVG